MIPGDRREIHESPAREAESCPAQFQCATEPVPLNYQHPAGQKISLTLIRLPASDPSERIGSLFIDFGGPGGPDVTDLVNRADTVFSPAIRARFDLVTWDPRGVEYSDPVNCFATWRTRSPTGPASPPTCRTCTPRPPRGSR
jgi:pimeloyl-ACP methyl ester carboxylesterase